MSLTAADAYNQLQDQIKRLGGWNPGNLFDGVIGVAGANVNELQEMLNKLLQKKGILGPEDEAVLKDLIARSEAERKKRQQVRTRYVTYLVGGILIIGGIVYLSVRKMKK
jgi:hypothetical protein